MKPSTASLSEEELPTDERDRQIRENVTEVTRPN